MDFVYLNVKHIMDIIMILLSMEISEYLPGLGRKLVAVLSLSVVDPVITVQLLLTACCCLHFFIYGESAVRECSPECACVHVDLFHLRVSEHSWAALKKFWGRGAVLTLLFSFNRKTSGNSKSTHSHYMNLTINYYLINIIIYIKIHFIIRF